MLKLTLKPGEYIDIGSNVRVIFSGGSANNIHLLIDAPKEVAIARSNAGENKKTKTRYYKESGISEEAQREIAGIIMKEKMKQQHESDMGAKPWDNTILGHPRKPAKHYYTAGTTQKSAKK